MFPHDPPRLVMSARGATPQGDANITLPPVPGSARPSSRGDSGLGSVRPGLRGDSGVCSLGGARPGSGIDSQLGSKESARPGSRGDARLGSKDSARPGSRPDSRPDSLLDSRCDSGLDDARPDSCLAGQGDTAVSAKTRASLALQAQRRASRKHENLYKQESLEEAYCRHVRDFEDNDDTSFGVEELISFLSSTTILDDWLTAEKIRLFFIGVSEGVNPVEYIRQHAAPFDENFITWHYFSSFMSFAADMKGIAFEDIETIVLDHFRTNSVHSGSMKWKIEVVFEAFGKAVPGTINAIEFVNLLRRTGVIGPNGSRCSVGDVLAVWGENAGNTCDFDECVELLGKVGLKTGATHTIYRTIADAVETLNNDEFVIVRVRLNLKEAASKHGVVDWDELFRRLDLDGSGVITFKEFHHMVRLTLKADVGDWDLRCFFRNLDSDKSGGLTIDELVKFITTGVKYEKKDTLSYARSDAYDENSVPAYKDAMAAIADGPFVSPAYASLLKDISRFRQRNVFE